MNCLDILQCEKFMRPLGVFKNGVYEMTGDEKSGINYPGYLARGDSYLYAQYLHPIILYSILLSKLSHNILENSRRSFHNFIF